METTKGSIARVTRTVDGKSAIYLCPSLAGILRKDQLFKKRIVERDWVFDEVVSYPYYFRISD